MPVWRRVNNCTARWTLSPEPKVSRARIVVVDKPEVEESVVGLPEAWKNFEDGTPQPNWTSLIREDRNRGH